VARILIAESAPELLELYELMLTRSGHVTIRYDHAVQEELDQADLLLVEPARGDAIELVRGLRERRPGLPFICASIYPQSDEVRELGPAAYLEKPFAHAQLESALARALDPP
jgi:DNA-binding NtrC family response regulator